jgi:hypothetical protein
VIFEPLDFLARLATLRVAVKYAFCQGFYLGVLWQSARFLVAATLPFTSLIRRRLLNTTQYNG